jgi:hypothetical protein
MKTPSRRRRSPAKVARAGGIARAGESDLELVQECPLRILRTEAEYRRAVAVLDRLSDVGPARTEDQAEYSLAPALFVEKYERAHESMPAATGIEMLGYLIQTHGVKRGETRSVRKTRGTELFP